MLRLVLATNAVNAALGLEGPLDKVVTMLEDLRDKVNAEGEEEAKTYNQFACFCKDKIEAKTEAITEGETEKDSLQAQLNEDISLRDQEDESIKDKIDSISALEEELAQLKKEHHEATLKYDEEQVDLTGALTALEAAIHAMKASKTAVSFAQLKPMTKTISKAILMAEALGHDLTPTPKAQRILSVLLGESDAPSYEFQGDDIISTLEGLKDDFRAQKDQLLSDHTEVSHTYESEKQDRDQQLELAEKALEEHKGNKAEAQKRIATASQDLTTVSAQLLDDQTYLADLSAKCNEKAVLWDERTQVRSDEIQAITQALTILTSDSVQGSQDMESESFVQMSASHTHKHPRDMSLARSNSRLHSGRRHSIRLGRRNRVVTVLRSQAGKVHSALLSRIAAAAAKDPFAKVKNLIQELIERLLAEAAEEANHKGWCDKEMSSATIQRDEKAEEIKELNTKLEVGEARRAKLRELVATLEKELEKLETSMSEADELRAKEKEENEASIEEAKEARDAVADAIQTLERFYKTAAKNEALLVVKAREAMKSHRASLLAQKTKASPEDDAPDAGFDDSYSGDQGGSTGVIGMLEVVKSDFERTISETEKNERDAKADHLEFGTTSGKSKATKETAKEEHEGALRDADAADEEDRSSLLSAQDSLNKALGELDSLHKACIDDGQSPEEKAQQREEELEALKQALCIMDAHGSSSADSC